MNILYCEDDSELREMMTGQLITEFPDSTVVSCPNGLEGQQKINSMTFDLIVSDFDMKVLNGDGISLFHHAKEKLQHDQFVFVIVSSHPRKTFDKYLDDSNFYYCEKQEALMGSTLKKRLIEWNVYPSKGF